MTAPRPRPAVMRIAPYVPGIREVAGANRTVKLSSNEGAFGVPPGAQRAYADAAAELYRYPDNDATELREAIGRAHGLDPARITCGVGSDDILYQLCLSYGGPGTEIVMTRHGFSIYEIAGQYAGSTVLKAPERNLTADVDAILALVSPATRIVFLANPNNPTGSLLPNAEVQRLRDGLPPDVLLVLDAAYAEYVDAPGYEAGAALVDAGDNTVMTRTFSKIYGLGGVRLGWCYAPSSIIEVLNRARVAFNVSAPAQAAGVAALAEPGWVETGRTHNTEWRAWLEGRLRAAGIKTWPSQCNFVLADFGDEAAAAAADAFLQGGGIIVRRVGGYGLPSCLRITVGTAEECGLVADRLDAFMAQAPVPAGA